MKSNYVLTLAVLNFILLECPTVLPVLPICLTWNTSTSYLIVQCSVMFATHDIFIVDQFGKIRGQCIIKDSWRCSGIETHDQIVETFSHNLTTLTLKTDKNTATGEWICRHGSKETKVYVSYLKGSVPMIDMEVSRETSRINETNIFKLTCSSCVEPYIKGVDFFINNILEDSIKYQSGLCYHKRKLCTPVRCSCLAGGHHFIWTYMSNLSFIQFTCAMRFKDPLESTIFIKKADVIFNGSVFIQKQKTNESMNQSDKTPDNTNTDKEKTAYSGYIGYSVAGIVCLIILIICTILFWRVYHVYMRRKNEDETSEGETISLQHIQASDSDFPPNNETETQSTLFTPVRNILNSVFQTGILGDMEQIAYCVLTGCGVEIDKNRVSFSMNKFQRLGDHHQNYLFDAIESLVRDRSFTFLRLYDFNEFSLNEFKANDNIYNLFKKVLQMIIDTQSAKGRYHYRRNGFTCKGSSEEAFLIVLQVYLSKKISVQFPLLSTYESRLETFHDYPIENKSCREKLALAGFFYFHVSDYVQCFHCGGCLRDWMYTFDPMVRHRNTFKTCRFALDLKWKKDSIKDAEPTTYDNMYTFSDRLNSFKSFPDTFSDDDFQRLAVAGFYYCGIAEDIVCFECNIGFADAQNSVNIIKLHKKYSPTCLNITKGGNYPQRSDTFDSGCISNFVPYLELEYRKHDF